MKLLLYIFLLLHIPGIIYAQKITFNLPGDANKAYAFALNKGIKKDTIQKGIIPLSGSITISIPEKDKDYVGMGSLLIQNNAPLNLIVNKENFTLTKDADNKLNFKDSKENAYLYSIMQDKVVPPSDTTLYAFHFIQLISYMQQVNKVAYQRTSLDEKLNTRLFAKEKLDMNRLYSSSIWQHIIDGLTKTAPSQEILGNDMVQILKRIDNQEVFEHLADNLITITEQYGWDDAFDIIVPYIKESGRIEVPQGNMFYAFALAKLKRGSVPPPLIGLKRSILDSDAERTLIVFYQSDCDNCHAQMESLINEYPKLKGMNVRIISVSADSDQASFTKDSKRYPWNDEDKLCDLKGFGGKNFINYGIMSTPVFILLDKKKKVIKRYARITEVDFSS